MIIHFYLSLNYRRAHNPKVVGSNPAAATITKKHCVTFTQCFFILGVWFKFYSLSHTLFFILREIKAMNEMTLAEWLDKWYDLYAKPFLKTSTLVSYNGYIENHIKPFIGQIKLSDLNGLVLQKFFNEKYKSGRLDNKGGLSEKTVLNIRQMLQLLSEKLLKMVSFLLTSLNTFVYRKFRFLI